MEEELKVSEMIEAENVNEEDLVMIVQDGINKKTKAKNIGIGGSATGDTLPIGATIEWHSDIIPKNWLLCNGQAVSRTDYPELFNVLGTRYGIGNGSATFNLPDLRKRVPVGKDVDDADFDTLGKTGGEKEHTLTIEEMPSHGHKWKYKNSASSGTNTWNSAGSDSTGTAPDIIEKTGGDQPHNNLQPYIVCNFIIKAKQSSGLVATVVDNLESTSEIDALSAKQGKVLKDKLQRHIMTARGDGASIIATSSGTKVNLIKKVEVGTKLTLENGGVKIGAGVNKISIEATTVFVSGQTGQHGIWIYKNQNTSDNLLARTMLNTGNNVDTQTSLNLVRRIIDNISEGDIIYMYVTSNINHEISAPLSMLTVEVVE